MRYAVNKSLMIIVEFHSMLMNFDITCASQSLWTTA